MLSIPNFPQIYSSGQPAHTWIQSTGQHDWVVQGGWGTFVLQHCVIADISSGTAWISNELQ